MGKNKRENKKRKNKVNKNIKKNKPNSKNSSKKPKLKIIGRTDILDFPGIGLKFVDVKVDTGAFNSSLHCEDFSIECIPFVGKVLIADFGDDKVKIFKKFYKREVTSSNGHKQERYLVMTTINILGGKWEIPLTLNNRSSMKYQCLLGRTFLSPSKLLVDVRELNISIDNVHNLFKGMADMTIYHKGNVLKQSDSIDELFHFSKNILYKDIEEYEDFRSTKYLKKMDEFYIINDGFKIPFRQITSFIYKTKKGWTIRGYSKFKKFKKKTVEVS